MYGLGETRSVIVAGKPFVDPITGAIIALPTVKTIGRPDIEVQGRGSWIVPILLGMLGFWFLSRGRGMRGDW